MAALAMCDGKERSKALQGFEDELAAPWGGGWDQADRLVERAIRTAE